MAVSHCIEDYLSVVHVNYQVVHHPFSESAAAAARSARVPEDAVVKAVMLRDEPGHRFAMALIPASNRLNLDWLPRGFDGLGLAREDDFKSMFPGCALGAIPGFGQAFELEMVWDEEFLERPLLYFEGGDHEALIRIGQYDFRDLFCRYPHAVISLPGGQSGDRVAAGGVH